MPEIPGVSKEWLEWWTIDILGILSYRQKCQSWLSH